MKKLFIALIIFSNMLFSEELKNLGIIKNIKEIQEIIPVPNEDSVIFSTYKKEIKLYNLANKTIDKSINLENLFSSFLISNDKKYIIGMYGYKYIDVIDFNSGLTEYTIETPFNIRKIVLSKDNKNIIVLSSDYDRKVNIYNTNDGKLVDEIKVDSYTKDIFLDDSNLYYIDSSNVKKIDLTSIEKESEDYFEKGDLFSFNSKYILEDTNNSLKIYSFGDKKEKSTIKLSGNFSYEMSNSENYIVTLKSNSSNSDELKLFDIGGKTLAFINIGEEIKKITISGNDKHILLYTNKNDLILLERETQGEIKPISEIKNPNLVYSIKLLDSNNDGILIGGKEKLLLKMKISNNGQEKAKKVIIRITKNDGSVSEYPLGDIGINEEKNGEIEYTAPSNVKRELVQYKFEIIEEKGFNPASTNFSFKTEPQSFINNNTKLTDIKYSVPSKIVFKSDIDILLNDYKGNTKSKNKWGIVLGVEKYNQLSSKKFSERDATLTREYFKKIVGIPEENILFLTNLDATTSQVKELIKNQIKNKVKAGDEIYIYINGYSGYDSAKNEYLVLSDSNLSDISNSSYLFDEFIADLGNISNTKKIVFLDNVSLTSNENINKTNIQNKNIVLFESLTKDGKIDNYSKNYEHNIFTYSLLKGLYIEADLNMNRKIEVEEIKNYLEKNITAKKLNENKPQMIFKNIDGNEEFTISMY